MAHKHRALSLTSNISILEEYAKMSRDDCHDACEEDINYVARKRLEILNSDK